MRLLETNLLLNYVKPFLTKHPLSSSPLQKKVALVALIVFGGLVACYTLYQICFRNNYQRSHQVNQKESFPNVWKKGLSTQKREVEEQNLTQKKDSKLKIFPLLILNNQAIYKYADITFKKASSLEEARIILIGEIHSAPSHNEMECYIINHFGRKGDILLLEDAEGKVKGPFDHMDTYGWDDLNVSHRHLIEAKEVLKFCEESEQRGPPDNLELSKQLLAEARRLKIKVRTSTYERTKALIRSVNDYLHQFPEKKIFLFAGRLHLMEEDRFNILDHLPQEEKCALVLLKDLGDGGDPFDYLKKLVATSTVCMHQKSN